MMKQINNIGNYLTDTLSKIDGFDTRWYSLITSEPLLFEDIDYFRCRPYVDNHVTPEELQAYRDGNLTEIYYTFESMLMCNLKHFDRIMSLCTIMFHGYVRIGGTTTSEHLHMVPRSFEATPTLIWCMAMCGINSTEWELNYAWRVSNRKPIITKYPDKFDQSLFEVNFSTIYKRNSLFRRFVEYAAYRCNTSGFVRTKIQDVTSARRLTDICAKFTRSTMVFDDNKIHGILKLIDEYKQTEKKLHKALTRSLQEMYANSKEYAVFIFENEFYLHSKKFKMMISKRERVDGTTFIQKEYISNSYECFVAEGKLTSSIKQQIHWAKYSLPNELSTDQQNLVYILLNMLKTDYKQIVCIRETSTSNVYSRVTFSGVFNNVYVMEQMFTGTVLVYETKKCMSKENAAKYLVSRGYYLFGTNEDVQSVISGTVSLSEHYTKYCIPVLKHMKDIQELHRENNQKIIDVCISRTVPPSELVVVDQYTTLKGTKKSLKRILQSSVDSNKNKMTYYQAINN